MAFNLVFSTFKVSDYLDYELVLRGMLLLHEFLALVIFQILGWRNLTKLLFVYKLLFIFSELIRVSERKMANNLKLTDLTKLLIAVVVCPQAHLLPRVLFIIRGDFSKSVQIDTALAHMAPTFERLLRHWTNDSSLTFVEDYLPTSVFIFSS